MKNWNLEVTIFACYALCILMAISFVYSLTWLPHIQTITIPLWGTTIVLQKTGVQMLWFLVMLIMHSIPTVTLFAISGFAKAAMEFAENTELSKRIRTDRKPTGGHQINL